MSLFSQRKSFQKSQLVWCEKKLDPHCTLSASFLSDLHSVEIEAIPDFVRILNLFFNLIVTIVMVLKNQR